MGKLHTKFQLDSCDTFRDDAGKQSFVLCGLNDLENQCHDHSMNRLLERPMMKWYTKLQIDSCKMFCIVAQKQVSLDEETDSTKHNMPNRHIQIIEIGKCPVWGVVLVPLSPNTTFCWLLQFRPQLEVQH